MQQRFRSLRTLRQMAFGLSTLNPQPSPLEHLMLKLKTPMKIKALLVLPVIAVLACSCSKPAGEATQAATKVSVNVRFPIPIIESGQTPFYVAQDKGYYDAEGITVTFGMGSRELNPVKTVATGQDRSEE